jgi:hypothetical protein
MRLEKFISASENQAELARNLPLGVKIKLTNVYVKHVLSNPLELVSIISTIIEVVSSKATP